jgi:hypothetical protein
MIMQTAPKHAEVKLFSQSPTEKAIELDFLRRLAALLPSLPAADLQRLALTGEFKEKFPAIEDETTPAPPRFEELKGFDYDDWASRHEVRD